MPLTDRLNEAKSQLGEVLENYPEAAHGSAWLEQAIGLVGQCETEVEEVEKNA